MRLEGCRQEIEQGARLGREMAARREDGTDIGQWQTPFRQHGSAPFLRAAMHRVSAYYSNLMKGQEAAPEKIDAILASKTSSDSAVIARQHLAFAHIHAEMALEKRRAEVSPESRNLSQPSPQ